MKMRGHYDEDVEVPEDAFVALCDLQDQLSSLTDDQRAAILFALNAPYCLYGCGGRIGCRCGDDS